MHRGPRVKTRVVGLFVFVSLLGMGCAHMADPMLEDKVLHPPIVGNADIEIDGEINEAAWRAALARDDFTFPWRDKKPPQTLYHVFMHESHLYFAYVVTDKDIVVADPQDGESSVAQGDRVEFFYASTPELDNYYCLEIDPDGNVLDYQAAHYRRFDDTWDCPGIEVATSRWRKGYLVEGRIPLESLRLAVGEVTGVSTALLFGLYRAEYYLSLIHI